MDINFNLEDKVFNYRIAAIIKKDNKILVTVRNNSDYVSFIGGRAKIGETSIEAVIREVKEETGYDTKHKRIMGIMENFYISRHNNKPYHEILIIHELEFADKNVYEKEVIDNYEETNAKFTWKSIEELKKENFKPQQVLDYLDKKEIFYLIEKNRKLHE